MSRIFGAWLVLCTLKKKRTTQSGRTRYKGKRRMSSNPPHTTAANGRCKRRVPTKPSADKNQAPICTGRAGLKWTFRKVWYPYSTQGRKPDPRNKKQARRFMPPGLRFCPGAPGPIRTADTRFRSVILHISFIPCILNLPGILLSYLPFFALSDTLFSQSFLLFCYLVKNLSRHPLFRGPQDARRKGQPAWTASCSS